MQPQGLYNLSIEHHLPFESHQRVGLLRGRTGIPVFLLYLKGLQSPLQKQCHSFQDVEFEIAQCSDAWNKSAWELVLPFFEADGACARVALLPISGSPKLLLKEMIGYDKGIQERTGIHLLRTVRDLADLVVVPQASVHLSGSEHRGYYQALFDLVTELEHFFLMVDFPKDFQTSDALAWLRDAHCPDAAAYFPWVIASGRVVSPGSVAAAAFQLNDQNLTIKEIPTNQKLSGVGGPLFNVPSASLNALLEKRLNVVHRFHDGSTRLWGGHTLADRGDYDARFIATRRSLVAIREAISDICEPFVLEPVNSHLEHTMNLALQSFFNSHSALFDAQNGFSSDVQIHKENGKDIVEVNVGFHLPHALKKMTLSLGIKG